MVWSLEDFERQISRQLVEMASIRRHAAGQHAALERLNRLEDSQLFLLRKLRETLHRREGSGETGRSGADDEETSNPEAFLHELLDDLQELTRQSYRLRHLRRDDPTISMPELHSRSELRSDSERDANPEVASNPEGGSRPEIGGWR